MMLPSKAQQRLMPTVLSRYPQEHTPGAESDYSSDLDELRKTVPEFNK